MKEFTPFRLDTVNQCLWRFGYKEKDERILLTPKAFAVLRHLVDRAGQLVSQDELLDSAWNHAHVEPGVLNNQILRLRHALGDRPKSPSFIETLPRRGYRFIAPVRDASPDANVGDDLTGELAGRQTALHALRDSLAKALNGRRQIIFITGETGIGKTALVDEFLRQTAAEAPGLSIARGQCIEGRGGREAYYPMLEALGQLCRGPAGDSVVRTLASHAPAWLVQFPALIRNEHLAALQRDILGDSRERMLREIGDALGEIASASPLVLVFEDVHWVDPSTVDLISALARHREPVRLIVLATYRPADAESSDSALKALTQDLLVHHLCHEIALEPLTEAQITEYLTGSASEPISAGALSPLLYRYSEGNPLFMIAALEHLSERGLIYREPGGWRTRGPLSDIDLGLPENLRRMIETIIDRLGTEEKRVLEAGSLQSAGCSCFGVATRSRLIEMDPEVFEDVCETLSRRHGILRPVAPVRFPDGTVSASYEFVHELYREVCYRRISPGRRMKLHRQLGGQVETRQSEQVGWAAP